MKAHHLLLLTPIAALLSGCYADPVANFDYTYEDLTAPAEVTFVNTSTDADAFRWDFGDGETSTDKNPYHTYNEFGTFTVNLDARGRGGEDHMSKNITILRPTTYKVRNLSSFDMYNVYTFYTEDFVTTYDEVSHGTIYSGGQSLEYITTRPYIELLFEFSGGTIALVSSPYYMSSNVLNYIDMTDQTYVITTKGAGKTGWKSAEGIRALREQGEVVKAGELFR